MNESIAPGSPKFYLNDGCRELIPAAAVTGIGSLPFSSTASALQAVATLSPEIPFWPQLPQLSEREGAIGQGLSVLEDFIEPRNAGYGYQVKEGRIDAALAALHRSDGQLPPANAAAFSAFEEAFARELFPSAVALKGQIEGPITLAAYVFHKGRPFLSDPALFAAIAFHVSQIICWQIDRLKLLGLPVILFVDEPGLCLEAHQLTSVSEEQKLGALAATLNDARRRGAVVGLHCCAASPFERMCEVNPDIVSFDANERLESFFANRHALEFVQKGGSVAYGLVPTWHSLDTLDPMTIFTRWLAAASMGGDPQELAQRAMITATCGLGLLETSCVADSFKLAHGVSTLIRNLA